MYFITEKTTATGKKLQAVFNKIQAVHAAQRKLAAEIGFSKWRHGYWLAYGGFSALIFDTKPDTKVFKRVNNADEWMPKLNTLEGRKIQQKLDACPKVQTHELNECIGFDGDIFNTIGVYQKNEKYFGFSFGEEWNVNVPEDCKEVMVSEFNNLFKTKAT